MNDQARAELRELQARAYGRGGDIHGDPHALRRLEELEAQLARAQAAGVARPDDARAARAQTDAPADAQAAAAEAEAQAEDTIEPGAWVEAGPEAADRGESGEGSTDATTGEADAEPAESESSPTSRWRRWMPWLWIGSVLVAAGLAATWNLASAAFTLIAGDTNTRQIEVIPVDSSFEGWSAIGPPEGQTGFTEFYGMTLVATDSGWFGGGPDEACLIVGRTSDVNSGTENISGPLFSGCSAGPFHATVQFVVTPEFPAEFLERFPEGEALQFVLNGDRVAVFVAAG